jgi:hypothetical protein
MANQDAMSIRKFASMVGVNHMHISRKVRALGFKPNASRGKTFLLTPEMQKAVLQSIKVGGVVKAKDFSVTGADAAKIHELEMALKELAVQHHIVLERMSGLESQIMRLREEVLNNKIEDLGLSSGSNVWGAVSTR